VGDIEDGNFENGQLKGILHHYFEISWLGEVEEVLLIASVVHSYFFDIDLNKAKQFVFLPKDLNW
jgi:hypothetical protein